MNCKVLIAKCKGIQRGVFFSAFFLLFAVCNLRFVPSASAAVSNILIVPASQAATIYWTSSSKEPSSVTYGILSGALIKSANDPIPVTFHSVTLSNLVPNTTYYFHIVESKNDNPTLTSTFRTLGSSSATSYTLPATSYQFTKNLKLGMTDPEVKQLQLFLNSQGILIAQSGPGSKGLETNYFGSATARAVSKFQELYAKDILIPNNLTKGTGAVLGSTRAKLNQLLALTKKNAPVASTQPVIQTPSYYSNAGGGGGGGGGSSLSPSPSYFPSPTFTPPAAGPTPSPTPSTLPLAVGANVECSDGIDNDGDGLIDFADSGCFLVNGQETSTDYGWTRFIPSSDTRIVYVSQSSGDDANSGLTAETAKRTITAGYALLRTGFPDWLLLKRGDTFTEGHIGWYKSGRSASETMIISSYGSLNSRPRLIDTHFEIGYMAPVSNLAFIGLHLERVNEGSLEEGIGYLGYGDNFLIEDCFISGFKDGIDILAYGGTGTLNNFKLRRSVVVDSYSTSGSHSQGLYLLGASGVLIEDTLFDHNGWKEGLAGAEATIFNHNMYLDSLNNDVVVRNTISANASSHGVQLRSGGILENNLFFKNPINALVGYQNNDWAVQRATGVVKDNVILDSRNINEQPRGFGLHLSKTSDLSVSGNIIAHRTAGSDPSGIFISENTNGLSLHDNIVYGWAGPPTVSRGVALNTNVISPSNNSIANNYFQNSSGGILAATTGSPSTGFSYAGNSYYSTDASSVWFLPAQSNASFVTWVSQTGETGTAAQTTFFDPSRTIATYNASLGGIASVAAFLAQARLQSKFNWRTTYTATAANAYIRAGFAVAGSVSPSSSPSPSPSPAPNTSPTPTPPSAPADITTGLVSKFSFEGNANDSVGGNNGIIAGGASFTPGKVGQALSFDGADDSVDTGTSSALNFSNSTAFSVSGWIKPVNLSGNKTIASRGAAFGVLWSFFIENDRLYALLANSMFDNAIVVQSSPGSIDTNWHYVTLTYDGSSQASGVNIYIDGILNRNTAINSLAGSFLDTTKSFLIGSTANASWNFNGLLDDVRVYNRALSSQEVQTLYINGLSGVAHAPAKSFLASVLDALRNLFR